MDVALACAITFDKAVDVHENVKKRQRWGAGRVDRVEHRHMSARRADEKGLRLCPWAVGGEARMVINRLASLLKEPHVRDRFTIPYVRPHVTRVMPTTHPPPIAPAG